MPTIVYDRYTQKDLIKLLDYYENSEWKCPKCGTLNKNWIGYTEVLAGKPYFPTSFQRRYGASSEQDYCRGFLNRKSKKPRSGYKVAPSKCNYKRPNSAYHNISGRPPRVRYYAGVVGSKDSKRMYHAGRCGTDARASRK